MSLLLAGVLIWRRQWLALAAQGLVVALALVELQNFWWHGAVVLAVPYFIGALREESFPGELSLTRGASLLGGGHPPVVWRAPPRAALPRAREVPPPGLSGRLRASGVRTITTGRSLRAITACATEPITARTIPVRPWVPMQMMSAPWRSAAWVMTLATSCPAATSTSTLRPPWAAARGTRSSSCLRSALTCSGVGSAAE